MSAARLCLFVSAALFTVAALGGALGLGPTGFALLGVAAFVLSKAV